MTRRSNREATGHRARLQTGTFSNRPGRPGTLLCAAAAVVATMTMLALGAVSASAAIVHSRVSSFGSFSEAMGLAVDQSTEDVYVYDGRTGEIYKFTASGEPAEFSSTKTDVIAGVSHGESTESELAVDSSSGPDKGDIYLAHGGENVEIFNQTGEKVGLLTEEAGVPWSEVCGVAVDPSGAVYLGLYGVAINKYVPKGGVVTDNDYAGSIGAPDEQCNVAIDSASNVFAAFWDRGPVDRWTASQFGTSNAAAVQVSTTGAALAVDPGNDELYVDQGDDVAQYGAHGEPFEKPVSSFASSIFRSYGIAVNGKTHDVYVANFTDVEVYGPGVHTPTPNSEKPKTVKEHSAVVTGSVNPEGSELTSCVFEYAHTLPASQSEPWEHSVPCTKTVGEIGAGSKPVPVEAELMGLTPSTLYYYRLVVVNPSGEYSGNAESFNSAGAPVISEQGVTQDTSGEATVTAEIDPAYEATSYHVEYGTTEAYGQSTTASQLPEIDGESHSVRVTMSGLSANTLYHFRFVAINSGGETQGSDQILATFAPTSPGLPDGRGYEQVTPEEKFGTEAFQPLVTDPYQYEILIQRPTQSNSETTLSFQAAADGNSLAFVEGPPIVGGNQAQGYGSGNEYLATRSPDGGWSQKLLSPEGAVNSVFEAFSPNLSTAFVSSEQTLSPDAPGYGEAKRYEEPTYDTLYTLNTAGGPYVPFETVKPPYREPARFGTAIGTAPYPSTSEEGTCGFGACIDFEGSSADDTHLLFAADDALTGASQGRPAAEGGTGRTFEEDNNLYESVNGQLRLVNVLPNGTTHAGATFGALIEKNENRPRADFSHVISADGSRIFWTDLTTGHIYMRENGTRTVEISPSGTYQTATDDGSTVYYTNGDLYAYDVETGQTTDLTPGVTVEQVAGASENGEYIYYVTSSFSLAVWHDGVSKTIMTTPVLRGSYQTLKAEVTPDGHSIVFEDFFMKQYPRIGAEPVTRVWVYDAETEALHCASCTSLGSEGSLQMTNHESVYKPRWISADGARVFFVSLAGLVPQDKNEEQDVYEWERDGSGSCKQSNGCLYMLSGAGVGQSSFLDASESGDDVFIVTEANLDGTDVDGAYDVYDVRVGAKPPAAQPACTGTGCQGVPPAPPTFATPPSLTYAGLGNLLPASPPIAVKKATKVKKTVRCKKGSTRKKHKCVKKKARARKASNDRGTRR